MSADALLVAGCSETHARDTNQDRLFPAAAALPDTVGLPACFAVADGMGGTTDGAEAAAIAVGALNLLTTPQAYLAHNPSRTYALAQTSGAIDTADVTALPTLQRQALLQHHFNCANQQIIERVGGPAKSGSTLSLLLLTPHAIDIAHLGDSRIYLLRQGHLYQLTQDHNVYGQRCKEGLIPFLANQLQLGVEDRLFLEAQKLSNAEFYYHPGRKEDLPQAPLCYIGQQLAGRVEEQLQLGKISLVNKDKDRLAIALGKQLDISDTPLLPTLPSALQAQPQRGDLFMLCTDGLSGVISKTQLQQRLAQIATKLAQTPDLAMLDWGCQQLFDDAVQAGSSDNVSILLIYLQRSEANEPMGNEPVANEQVANEPTLAYSQAPQDTEITEESELPPGPLVAQHHNTIPGNALDPAETPWAPLPPKHTAHMRPAPRGNPRTTPPTKGALSPRHYQGIIALLLLALVGLFTFHLKQTRSRTPDPRIPPRQRVVTPTTGHHLGLFWVPLPSLVDAPLHQARLRWLQRLQRDNLALVQSLGLRPGSTRLLERALQAPSLSHTRFLQALQKLPREPQDLAAFDNGLRKAVATMWTIIAPTYQRYLDDMREPLALPKSTMAPNALRTRRRKFVQRWQRDATDLLRHDWRTLLLTERLLIHPPMGTTKPKPKARQQLQRCMHTLKEAHTQLKSQNPRHPLLAPLHNRIQLHQAHLSQ